MTGISGIDIVANKTPMSREETIRLIDDASRMAELKRKYRSGNITKSELVEIGARLALEALNPDRFIHSSQRGNI